MVLLHGRAAAGKSRAGLQAVRVVRADVPLLVPRDGRALRDLVDAGLLDAGPGKIGDVNSHDTGAEPGIADADPFV